MIALHSLDCDVHCRKHCFAIHAWQDKAEKRELRENLSHDDPRWTAPRADGRCGPAFGPSMVYAGSSLIFHTHR